MDYLSGLSKSAQSDPSQDSQTNTSDLFFSAKAVAGAAQSQLRSEDYDKAKAAGAGADLLGAASEYGKLDETQGVGKYVGQGEEYLRNYSNPDAAATEGKDSKIPDSDDSAPAKTLAGEDDSGDLKSGLGDKSAGAAGESDVLKSCSGDDTGVLKSSGVGGDYSDDVKTAISVGGEKIDSDEVGGGVGEYAKKAEGFLSKTSGEAEGEETEVALKKGEEGGVGDDVEKKTEAAAAETQSAGGGGFGSSVMKMAGGFLKK